MVFLKEFHRATDRGPSTAPQPQGEGTQPSHSATKHRADTQGAMHSSTRSTYCLHLRSFGCALCQPSPTSPPALFTKFPNSVVVTQTEFRHVSDPTEWEREGKSEWDGWWMRCSEERFNSLRKESIIMWWSVLILWQQTNQHLNCSGSERAADSVVHTFPSVSRTIINKLRNYFI